MSEKDNVDGSGEEKSPSPVNRRRFVKSLGAAGIGVTGLGALSGTTRAAGRTKVGSEVQITETTLLQGSRAAPYRNLPLSSKYTQSLKHKLIQDTDLRPDPSNTVVSRVTTNDERINDHEPTLAMVPFRERGKPSPDDETVGFLNALVMTNGDEKDVASSFGMAVESKPSQASALSLQPSTSGAMLTSFGTVDGSAVQMDQERISSGGRQGDVTTQGLVGCTTCSLIATGVCNIGIARLGPYGCIAVCTPFVSTFAGYFVCASSCSVILNAIAKVGCTAGSIVICNEAGLC